MAVSGCAGSLKNPATLSIFCSLTIAVVTVAVGRAGAAADALLIGGSGGLALQFAAAASTASTPSWCALRVGGGGCGFRDVRPRPTASGDSYRTHLSPCQLCMASHAPGVFRTSQLVARVVPVWGVFLGSVCCRWARRPVRHMHVEVSSLLFWPWLPLRRLRQMTSGDVRSQVLVVMMVGYRLSPYRPRAVVFVDVGACKDVACPGGHAAAMDGKERYTVDYIPASVRARPLRQCRRFCTSGLQNWLRVGCLGDGRVRDGGVRLINTARGVTSLAVTSLRWMRVVHPRDGKLCMVHCRPRY